MKTTHEENSGPENELSQSISKSTMVSLDESHRAYVNFVSSLRTPITRKAYVIRLKNYLRSPLVQFSTFDELLNRDRRLIEQGLIDILINMRYELNLSFSAQNIFLCALTHFFSINDVTINRKKIKKFMSESENKYEYRSYTIEEIRRLLLTCDERERAIILLLASTGMRVGAVHPLRLKDLKKWAIDEQGNYIYQIQVYSSSSKHRYYTFCTPECAVAIDDYLELRQRYGDKLMKTETGWNPPNAHLIIRAFNRKSFDFIPIPIKCRTTITTNIIVPKLEAINLRNRKSPPSVKPLQKTMRHERGDLHPCHSFRIFAITQMQRAKLDKTIREMLVGHSTGLDSVYYKATDEEIFLEYLKSVNNLTIYKENKSGTNKNENKQSEPAEIIKLKEEHKNDLFHIRNEMNQKFNQIFSLIQQNPNLAKLKPGVLETILK